MTLSIKKICVVTGSRAEYGLLSQLIQKIDSDPDLTLQLLVTGMHLSPEFSLTYREIEEDGIAITEKIEMLLSSDTAQGITKSVGLGTIGFADAFVRHSPDIVILLGDRFEMLAAAQAALFFRIPIAHIHGGEASEGAYDESIRHALTKMSTWHFVAAKEYRNRVIQMGELPERVFNVGAPGLDNLHHKDWMSRAELEASLNMRLQHPLFLVTYHPATLSGTSSKTEIEILLTALEKFPDASIIFTYPNADSEGRILITKINEFIAHNSNAKAFASLGRLRYLSLLQQVDVIIGNSSSGIIEGPYFHKATVNVGNRQDGRLKATSVIDVPLDTDKIITGIQLALSNDFSQQLSQTQSLYGYGKASEQIVDILKKAIPTVNKPFFDIKHEY